MFDNIDPRHIAAAAGSAIGAGLDFVKNVLSHESGVTLRSALLGALNFFFQLFAGFCGAIYFGPLAAKIQITINGTEFGIDERAAIFGVGLAFYKLLPVFITAMEKALATFSPKGG